MNRNSSGFIRTAFVWFGMVGFVWAVVACAYLIYVRRDDATKASYATSASDQAVESVVAAAVLRGGLPPRDAVAIARWGCWAGLAWAWSVSRALLWSS